jgi:hypothetical protein
MRASLDELLAVVYRYYARGQHREGLNYKQTEEYLRLVQARIKAGNEDLTGTSPWCGLLARLSARFPDHQIQNGSFHLPTGEMDAGHSGLFWLPPRGTWEKNHVLGFLVSFIAPSYVVYSSAHVVSPSLEPHSAVHDIRFTFSPDEEPYAQAIIAEIDAVFPRYEPMPPEIGNQIVSDVAVGNQLIGKATLYHCLFTECW